MKKNIGKTIWAVLAGVLGIIIATTLVDIVLHLAGIFPAPPEPLTDSLALVASSYRLLFGVAGGYLTAMLAPARPLRHALLLGYVGIVLGLIGVIATWNLGLGPQWYPISLVVLAVPQCWLGGRLRERQGQGAVAAASAPAS